MIGLGADFPVEDWVKRKQEVKWGVPEQKPST